MNTTASIGSNTTIQALTQPPRISNMQKKYPNSTSSFPEIEKQLKQVIEDAEVSPFRSISDFALNDLIVKRIDSGFKTFDRLNLIKANRGELIIIGGRPSTGKSALAFQIALNVAAKYRVAIVSLEMDQEEIVSRFLSSEANVFSEQIKDKEKHELIKEKLIPAHAKLSCCDLGIIDGYSNDIDHITKAMRLDSKQKNTKLFIIDHLQLIHTPSHRGTRDSEIGYITSSLKRTALELQASVILLSQLNRSFATRIYNGGDGKPQLSDLRDSGNTEADADTVILLHRDRDKNPSHAEAIIAKNRTGPIGTVDLHFISGKTEFRDSGSKDIVEDKPVSTKEDW